jgi:replicative DNA helicase
MENPAEKSLTDRTRAKAPMSNLLAEIGKMPPQALDLEEAVLGAMMLEKEAVNHVIDILNPDSFYKESHKKIYKAIQELFGASEPIDILTVTNQLKKKGELELVGGPFYVSNLTNRVASSAHVEYHARIIAQKYIQREVIRLCSEGLKMAYEDTTDVFELLNKVEGDLFAIAEGNIKKNYDKMEDVLKQAIMQIEEAAKNKDGVSGVPTGFKDLDRITSGWQKSDMIVCAARPGMGKTAFVISMARNTAVDYNMGVAIFSLEMASVQLVNRMISSETGISSEKLRKGNLAEHEFKQLHERIGKLSKAPIFIDDTPALSIFDLRAKCRRLKMQHNIQLVIIDYLQLMTAGGSAKGNREQEISTISRSIKEIAKEINVPIIALSQLSRSVETRGGDKKPLLSDLRESGAIEQDADIVTFIYRPEYYGIMQDEEGVSTADRGDIIIAKNRHGSLDTVSLRFVKHLVKFTNMDDFADDPMIAYNQSLAPNRGFEQEPAPAPSTYTIASKMDSLPDDDDFNFKSNELEDDPF